jgi:hypothetical protein
MVFLHYHRHRSALLTIKSLALIFPLGLGQWTISWLLCCYQMISHNIKAEVMCSIWNSGQIPTTDTYLLLRNACNYSK